jgi:hypothetical protein
MANVKKKEHLTRGVRIVSLFEGAKGLLVVFVGFGLLEFLHKDLHLEEVAGFVWTGRSDL